MAFETDPSTRFTMTSLIVIALALVLITCNTVPLTGRSQLDLMDSAELASMGEQAYVDLLKEEPVITRGPAVSQVRRVGERIRDAAENGDFAWPERGTFNWEFKVVDNKEIANAWALPGGKVAVYTGIIDIAQSDAGLATVMGHEIAHAIARHGGERMSTQAVTEFGRQGAAQVLSTESKLALEIFEQAYNLGAAGFVLLPFSRKHESEADRIGLLLMAAAGYDPREAVGFWQRMSAGSSGGQPLEFLSTHPSHETRISNLEMWMPEALEVFRGERTL